MSTCVCMSRWMCVHMHRYICVCACAYMSMSRCVCVHAWVCVSMSKQTRPCTRPSRGAGSPRWRWGRGFHPPAGRASPCTDTVRWSCCSRDRSPCRRHSGKVHTRGSPTSLWGTEGRSCWENRPAEGGVHNPSWSQRKTVAGREAELPCFWAPPSPCSGLRIPPARPQPHSPVTPRIPASRGPMSGGLLPAKLISKMICLLAIFSSTRKNRRAPQTGLTSHQRDLATSQAVGTAPIGVHPRTPGSRGGGSVTSDPTAGPDFLNPSPNRADRA